MLDRPNGFGRHRRGPAAGPPGCCRPRVQGIARHREYNRARHTCAASERWARIGRLSCPPHDAPETRGARRNRRHSTPAHFLHRNRLGRPARQSRRNERNPVTDFPALVNWTLLQYSFVVAASCAVLATFLGACCALAAAALPRFARNVVLTLAV